MATTPETSGTTLEVLAPYLPYGIEVEVKDVRREGHLVLGTELVRGVLIGITTDPLEREGRQKQEVAYSPHEKRWLWRWAYPDMITPILRPFSQLCDPLPDGTVALWELGRLIIQEAIGSDYFDLSSEIGRVLPEAGDWQLTWWPQNKRRDNTGTGRLIIGNHGSMLRFRLQTQERNGWTDWGVVALSGIAIDYLRRHHFAIGLAAHQYIAKDPAPASTTIQEGRRQIGS
jgi:hypothetical protein